MKTAFGKIAVAASISLAAVLFAAAPASAESAPPAQVSTEVTAVSSGAADWDAQRWAGQRWAGQRWAGQRWAGQRWAGTGWS